MYACDTLGAAVWARKKAGASVAVSPRIVSLGVAKPPFTYEQETIARITKENILGPAWRDDATKADDAQRIDRLFTASRVQRRQCAIEYEKFYAHPRSTGDRMAAYAQLAYPLAREAVEKTLAE